MINLEKTKYEKCQRPSPPTLLKDLPLHNTPIPIFNFSESLPPLRWEGAGGGPNYVTYIFPIIPPFALLLTRKYYLSAFQNVCNPHSVLDEHFNLPWIRYPKVQYTFLEDILKFFLKNIFLKTAAIFKTFVIGCCWTAWVTQQS